MYSTRCYSSRVIPQYAERSERTRRQMNLMNGPITIKSIAVCDTQPVTADGVRTLLTKNPDLEFRETIDSLGRALELMRHDPTDVVLVDKAFGIQAILEWVNDARQA